ncbi:MAG: HD-GYP domain-containing protein [Lachnospiraceae bacterium]|nr:HD-GYP domain-containing protein [Lachnospiraceae bacterium]
MRYFKNKRVVFFEYCVTIIFCILCIFFGVFVSYSDFWDGKQIICFLMMMIYVGLMMMYRPYITILTLTGYFFGFYKILLTFQGGLTFAPKEVEIHGAIRLFSSGDTVNYITFLASLITICVAFYHGRLGEAKKSQGIYRLFSQTAEALALAIDAKDNYTHGHSIRVAEYSKMIAKAYGKSEEECDNIFNAALLHDVGKIGVPDAIINKNGKLTKDEYEEIKLHPVYGHNILSRISESPYLSTGAHYHHERFDGKGYPEGLKGDKIPELARIIAVADAYDAMTSARSYREPFPQDRVREEIEKGIGTQFDPKFAGVMLELIDKDTSYNMRDKSLNK